MKTLFLHTGKVKLSIGALAVEPGSLTSSPAAVAFVQPAMKPFCTIPRSACALWPGFSVIRAPGPPAGPAFGPILWCDAVTAQTVGRPDTQHVCVWKATLLNSSG